MSKIFVTKEEPDPVSATEYVQFRAWAGQDGEVYGDWMRVKSNVTSRVHIEASEPREVEAAWEEAKAYAALNDLVWFYIQDEGDVFPAAKLGVVPTSS